MNIKKTSGIKPWALAIRFTAIAGLLFSGIAFFASADSGEGDRTLYINGVIWTGAASAEDASVMLVRRGQIEYVGNRIPDEVESSTTVDLKGRFVTPGLIDNHVHFIEGGAGLAAVQLRDASTPQEFTSRIVEFAKSVDEGEWVLFGNWDHQQWGGDLPKKEWIDTQLPDTPVFVMRLDGHMGFANSAALKLAGINKYSQQPQGGEIVKDKNGEPTGVLKDTAMEPVMAAIPKPTDAELLRAIEAAQSHALKLGLTKVHAMSASPTDTRNFEAFIKADKNGLLKIRVAVYTPIEHWQKMIAKPPQYRSDLLTWAGFKGLTDGSLGSTTAWFYDAYTDVPDTSGLALIEPDELRTMIKAADAADIKLAIHAIGDKAIDEAIAAMRASAGSAIKARRYRIEHFQHPSAAAIKAMAEAQIIASMQPYHAIDDGRWAEKRIGADRIRTTYAFKSILDAGGVLSFGSDWPVAPLSPLTGIEAAVDRQTIDGANPDGWQPQEKITVEQALRAYTRANAYAGFEDDIAGTLEAGKRADFVIFEEDLRTVKPEDLASVRVWLTVINGEAVYSLAD